MFFQNFAFAPPVRSFKIIAIASLIILAFIYRSGEADKLHRFAPHWWGILGLIGWAYFISALVFPIPGNKFFISVTAWLMFLSTCMASHVGLIPSHSLLSNIIAPFGSGSMPAFTMGGVITPLILLHFRQGSEVGKMTVVLLLIAAVFFISGFYLRTFWGISKIRATPAWVLICSGITIVTFIILYSLIEVKGKANWFKIILPAGTNTLLCYLLPYYAYDFPMMFHFYLPGILLTGVIGLVKSFLFAMLIVIATGWLGKLGLRLRL